MGATDPMSPASHSRPFAPACASHADRSIRGSHFPVFGICGHSGSGKTTLILELIRHLSARGLKIGVVKHDAHGLDIDREGKDSDRFFRAGADVLIRDPEQLCLRAHGHGDTPLQDLLAEIGPYFDLILVEGYKTTPLDMKIWLCGDGEDAVPSDAVNIRRALRRNEDRVAIALRMIDRWLPDVWRAAPVYAGILIGGKSSRMGRSKHLLSANGRTLLERMVACVAACVDQVVLLGQAQLPAALRGAPLLPDVEDAQGPLRGMLAGMRWAPFASWVFLPCDAPGFSEAALRWLLEHRRPGVRAVLPFLPEGLTAEPLPGYYDRCARQMLERVRGPSGLAGQHGVICPRIPTALADAWQNVNTPEEWKRWTEP